MSATASPSAESGQSMVRQRVLRALRATAEGLVLVLVCFAPWPFGSAAPLFEFVLFAGVAGLLVLWALIILVGWDLTWKRCPVALGLAGLIIIGLLQLAPLPDGALRLLSPTGAALLHDLKPAVHEQLVSGQPLASAPHPAGTTLSLYPAGTRLILLRLLAVFVLFAAVRNLFATKESLRRLTLVCLINGSALSLFALIQFYTAQRHVVFWSFETGGTVFGPFVNRNDFAFYVNICACLVAGLLAGRWLGRHKDRTWSDVLRHTPTLWLGGGLVLMLTGLAFCLSRGGLLSLAVGCLVAVFVRGTAGSRRSWWGPLGVMALLTLTGVMVWLVLPRVEPRLATLWHTNLEDARLAVWANALTIGRDYPVSGSGYGTFAYLELSRRSPGHDPRLIFTSANNDYLEALAEGGLPRLVVSLAIIAMVFTLAMRAYRRYYGHPSGGWILGGVAAFTCIVVHSFFEFGLHIPSISVLATVLAAHLAALGSRRNALNQQEQYELRLLGLGPILGVAVLLAVAATLTGEGWRLSQAARFRGAATHRDLIARYADRTPQIDYLERAVRYDPDDASLRLALAEAHLFRDEQWQGAGRLAAAMGGPLTGESLKGLGEPDHRSAAARQLLIARDLCPVMVQPQVDLAALRDQFSSPDAATVYLKRATQLGPTDPQLWFLRGNGEKEAGQVEEAWQCWRRTLELSSRYLPDILKQLGNKPDTSAVAERLLPPDPELLIRAAQLLDPDREDAALRKPLLRRAVEIMEQQPGNQAKDLHNRGVIQDSLGDRAAAIASYRLALDRDSKQTEWRYEFADLLYRDGKPGEAAKELQRVLQEKPDHKKAKALQDTVQAELP